MIRELAIDNSWREILDGEVIFLVRAYNEGKVISETISNILEHGYSNILIIDDGSKDDTYEKIYPYIGQKVVYLKHIKNRWAWAALETGFEYLRRYGQWKYICCFDADGQHSIDDVHKFITQFEKYPHTQVVFWSRFIEKTNSNIPFLRRIILKIAVIFTFILSHVKLSDAHNGFRMFRSEIIHTIQLRIGGMWYASELIDIIASRKIPFREVPVNIQYTEYSIAKWQKNSNAINIAFHFIWSKFFK